VNLRDIKGKRIVGIEQSRGAVREGPNPEMATEVRAIILEDGTEIRIHPYETDWEPRATAFVVKPTAGRKP